MKIIDFYAPTKKRVIAISILLALFFFSLFITYINTPPCGGDMCFGPNTLGTVSYIISIILFVGYFILGNIFVLISNSFHVYSGFVTTKLFTYILLVLGAIISIFIWYTIICFIFKKGK